MKRVTAVSAMALLAMTGTAWADVTPQQVWDDFETYLTDFGYTVTANEAMSGDTLTVSDVVFSAPMPEEGGAFEIQMDSVGFTDRGDGTVSVQFPETMPIVINVNDGEEVEIVLDYTHQALEMIVSGDADVLVYDYTADQLGMKLGSLTVDGENMGDNLVRFNLTAGPVEGRSEVAYGDLKTITQAVSMGDIAYDFAADDPDSTEGGSMTGKLLGLVMNAQSTVPPDMDFTDMVAAIAAGFGGTGSLRHSGGEVEFSVTEGAGDTNGKMTSTGGLLEVGFTEDALVYNLGGTGQTIFLAGPEIPLPINASIAETAFNIMIPLQASEAPQDAAIGMRLAGFEMADMLWSIFDPGQVLPRDPATVAIDMTAKVTPFVSLLDPEQMAKVESGEMMPGELNAVTLTDLVVEAAGGKITGSGDFVFDNSDLESFDGMPRPEGKLDLQVSGHNGLIDRLIEMGLLAEEDAMGARMMLSMFTVPGDAEDTASSTIEINSEGHILANGQRIQ